MTGEIKYTRLIDGRFLFEDPQGNKLGVIFSDNTARILFADCRKSLIKAVEAMAIAGGKKSVTYDFADRYDELRTTFLTLGYEHRETKSILSVDLKDLLSSKGLRDIMMAEFNWGEWIPMRDLLPYQFNELDNLFEVENVPISRLELPRFDSDFSGIVYDSNRRIRAFALSSAYGDEIVFECLFGDSKENQKYLMTAVRGIVAEAFNCGKEEVYKRLTAIELNHGVRAIIRNLLDDKYEISERERVMHMHKVLSSDDELPLPTETVNNSVTQFAALNAMEEKLNSLYLQNNINWRSRWNVQ